MRSNCLVWLDNIYEPIQLSSGSESKVSICLCWVGTAKARLRPLFIQSDRSLAQSRDVMGVRVSNDAVVLGGL